MHGHGSESADPHLTYPYLGSSLRGFLVLRSFATWVPEAQEAGLQRQSCRQGIVKKVKGGLEDLSCRKLRSPNGVPKSRSILNVGCRISGPVLRRA